MEDQKVIHRIHNYLKLNGIAPTRFEKEIGLSNGYLGTQLKRNGNLGEEIINVIINNCRDINPTWLLTGKGEMLIGGKKYAELHHDTEPNILSEPPMAQNSDLVAYLERKLDEKTRECYDLQAKIEGLASELRRRREAPAEEQPLASVG